MRRSLLLPSFLIPALLSAQAGTLDPTFGTGGIVNSATSNYAVMTAVRPDGRVLTGGKSFLGGYIAFTAASYTSEGLPDPSFGTDGIARISFMGNDEIPFAMAVQNDGKVVIAGYVQEFLASDFKLAAVRFNADGTPDGGFGTGGKVLLNTGVGDAKGYDLALRSDGRIVIAGSKGDALTDLIVACLNTDGTPYTGFSGDGYMTMDISDYDQPTGIAIHASNKITIAVKAYDVDYFPAIARINADGTPDTGFGTGGSIAITQNGFPVPADMATRPNGGYCFVAGPLVGALNVNGSVDASFGTNGVATATVAGVDFFAYAALVQPDGRTVIAGTVNTTGYGDNDHMLVRFDADGTMDLGFGTGGALRFGTTTNDEITYALAWSPDNAIIGAGSDLTSTFVQSYTTYKVRSGGLLGIEASAEGTTLNAYPNPCTNTLTVQHSISRDRYRILDVTGRIVRDGRITTSGPFTLDTSELETGEYLLQLVDDLQTASIRFIRH